MGYCYIGHVTSTLLHALSPIPVDQEVEEPSSPAPDGEGEPIADKEERYRMLKVTQMLEEVIREQTTEEATRSTAESAGASGQSSRSIQVFCNFKLALAELPKSPEFLRLENLAKTTNSWITTFTNDRATRYRFLTELMYYATYMTKNSTSWDLLPGYYDLIQPVLVDMAREAPLFSKNTLALSKPLLYNIRLLSPFLKIGLEATNLYDTTATASSIQRMEEWFSTCRKKHHLSQLPPSVDYHFLRRAIHILLVDNEHFNTLLAALIFLYK
jgi:hypothetical protein